MKVSTTYERTFDHQLTHSTDRNELPVVAWIDSPTDRAMAATDIDGI
jgi:hypothetical protein